MHALELVPTTWSSADDDFFRVVARLLPPAFVAGAGVLLAGYDDDGSDLTPERTPGRAPVVPQRTGADPVPVRVRRTS